MGAAAAPAPSNFLSRDCCCAALSALLVVMRWLPSTAVAGLGAGC